MLMRDGMHPTKCCSVVAAGAAAAVPGCSGKGLEAGGGWAGLLQLQAAGLQRRLLQAAGLLRRQLLQFLPEVQRWLPRAKKRLIVTIYFSIFMYLYCKCGGTL
jgi:hypothetical protein